MSHHGIPEEESAKSRMLAEFLGNSKPRFPQGKIDSTDEGELAFAIAVDQQRKAVVIRFSKPVDWLGFGRDEALALANKLIEKAAELPK
jgi:hypothetical protein